NAVFAQDGGGDEPAAPAAAESADGPDSPRQLLKRFFRLRNQKQTRDLVDLLEAPAGMPSREVERRALVIGDVLDFHGYIDVGALPDAKAMEGEDEWTLWTAQGAIRAVALQGRWVFSAATVEAAPAMQAAFEATGKSKYKGFSLREYMPESLLGSVLFLEHWQWMGLAALLLLSWIAYHVLVFVAHHVLLAILKGRGWGERGKDAADHATRPLGYFGTAAIIVFGTPLLLLPLQPVNFEFLSVMLGKFFASLGAVLSCYRLADVAGARMAAAAAETESKLDDQLVPLVRKSIKILVTVGGILFILDNLDVDIMALLAGISVAGIGFAFAAKDTIANLFGSITVFLDKPFQVGDWIQFKGVDGTVEEVGFRSTRLRTFYNSVVSIPNANLVTTEVDNYGMREFRRYSTRVGIEYDTPPETIEAFCEGIRAIVRANPNMRQDYYHVYFNDFGDSGLQILLYVFFAVDDWGIELRERQNFLVEVLRLARELGVGFAFPTQTLHVASSPEQPLASRQSPPVDELDALVRRFDKGGDLSRPGGTEKFSTGRKETPEAARLKQGSDAGDAE
ncbi:MAG: mechanosensitive ion channel family protein, partial [Planctomycetota bacterium]